MRVASAYASWPLVAATLLAGCLPSSCNREESQVLFAADSVSRAFAERLPVDTLSLVYATSGQPRLFDYPRTVAFDVYGGLFVSDAEANQLVRLDKSGIETARFRLAGAGGVGSIPFIAGVIGDTVVVFSADANAVAGYVRGEPTFRFRLADLDASRPLRYVAVGASDVWVKSLDPDSGARAVRYTRDGVRGSEVRLAGPYWAHAGVLHAAGDSILSVRGYMPIVDVIGAGNHVDSVRLGGFDSPMLARMRSYQLGKTSSPPLLIPSAAYADGRLYIINARPGWLRVDVYGSDWILEAILVEPNPRFDRSFFPTDIAVRRDGGRVLIAVSAIEPRPGVRVFAWTPAS